ncbi:MAG: galactokinase family protein [Gemmatimonadota bacterium]|nr:galactokinase family protein [Gemmatimonadota bacterium]
MGGGPPIAQLEATFERRFGEPASAVARAPGRVNLIGEHIDYCGLPVVPMALSRSVRLLFRPRADGRVRIETTARGLGASEFRVAARIDPAPRGHWSNYPRAAVQAVAGDPSRGPASGAWAGFDGLVSSDLPIAAGLSSSSALVVATALATLAANRRASLPGGGLDVAARRRLATVLAEGERYVGTAGGGMDQAVALLGRAGCAIRLDFEPLRATPIPVPSEWRVVVAHSGERAEKSASAQTVYNERTREALGALEAVRPAVGAATDAGYPDLVSRGNVQELLAAARRTLESPLDARFRHIVTEADRVERFVAALRVGDRKVAGELLLASHASLRDDYEVSTPRLDALVEAAVSAGAYGARLTGAGLGGCMLALCGSETAERVEVALRSGAAGPGNPVFTARPGEAASVSAL